MPHTKKEKNPDISDSNDFWWDDSIPDSWLYHWSKLLKDWEWPQPKHDLKSSEWLNSNKIIYWHDDGTYMRFPEVVTENNINEAEDFDTKYLKLQNHWDKTPKEVEKAFESYRYFWYPTSEEDYYDHLKKFMVKWLGYNWTKMKLKAVFEALHHFDRNLYDKYTVEYEENLKEKYPELTDDLLLRIKRLRLEYQIEDLIKTAKEQYNWNLENLISGYEQAENL